MCACGGAAVAVRPRRSHLRRNRSQCVDHARRHRSAPEGDRQLFGRRRSLHLVVSDSVAAARRYRRHQPERDRGSRREARRRR